MQITLRAVQPLPNLRSQRIAHAFEVAMARASANRFRLVHYSLQTNHVHLIVEALDRATLSRGLQGLAIRLARGANRAAGRRGKVWAERYHERELRSPREVRNALVYVLNNVRKHGGLGVGARAALDPLSSARWFDGWSPASSTHHARLLHPGSFDDPPVVAPRTWLLQIGWQRSGGLLDARESPAPPRGPQPRASRRR